MHARYAADRASCSLAEPARAMSFLIRSMLLIGRATPRPEPECARRSWPSVPKRAQRAAHLEQCGGIHRLHHTFCSHLVVRGATVMAIKALAGHASISTTQHYMHLSPSTLDAAIGLLDAAWNAPEVGEGDRFVRNGRETGGGAGNRFEVYEVQLAGRSTRRTDERRDGPSVGRSEVEAPGIEPRPEKLLGRSFVRVRAGYVPATRPASDSPSRTTPSGPIVVANLKDTSG